MYYCFFIVKMIHKKLEFYYKKQFHITWEHFCVRFDGNMTILLSALTQGAFNKFTIHFSVAYFLELYSSPNSATYCLTSYYIFI
jgi:hypothetical protein